MADRAVMAASDTDTNVALDKLLNNNADALLPDELRYLISAFVPSQPANTRSKAYLVLSAFCQGIRSKQPNAPTAQPDPKQDPVAKVFRDSIFSRITSDEETSFLQGLTFLAALFQVDSPAASLIFGEDAVLDAVMDSVELTPSQAVARSVAELVGQAAGYKACRTIFTSQVKEWLEAESRKSKDSTLRAAAVVALIKLSKGTASDNLSSGISEVPEDSGEDMELAKIMQKMVIHNDSGSKETIASAIEGLVYASNDPRVKEALSKDEAFLKGLFSLVPRHKASQKTPLESPSLVFGVTAVIANICAYRPRLSEEQSNIERLKKMTRSGKKSNEPQSESDKLDDDAFVKARIDRLVSAGVLEPLCAGTLAADSLGVRIQAGRTLLNIIEDKTHRGKVLQAGGAKVLQVIIKSGLPEPNSKQSLDPMYLPSIQALAKLAITSPPLHVFGPNEGALYDAIRPLALLLLHDSSNLLQRFEAIMALTNVSSQSAEAASRTAKFSGLLNKVELLMLEDHALVQRAATELVCNLVGGSETVFERYSKNKSKVQVLLALSDVDDLQTRLAASGALAMLTGDPNACASLFELQLERKRVFRVLVELVDPSAIARDEEEEGDHSLETHPGLQHRGIVCLKNLFATIDDQNTKASFRTQASEAGLLTALASLIKSAPGPEVLQPTKEVMQFMLHK